MPDGMAAVPELLSPLWRRSELDVSNVKLARDLLHDRALLLDFIGRAVVLNNERRSQLIVKLAELVDSLNGVFVHQLHPRDRDTHLHDGRARVHGRFNRGKRADHGLLGLWNAKQAQFCLHTSE
jgi:hypothetical protein